MSQTAMQPQSTATTTLERNRQAYAGLAEVLENAGLAEHALYLNWGYAPQTGLADWASCALPAGETGMAQARLILEVLGDTQLAGKRVLDVGCGRGGALALLARLYPDASLAGADLSAANIAYCRKRHQHARLRFQLADACRLPYADQSVDVLLNLESSGAYPDLPAFFAHAYRVLKPGGRFCYADVIAADTFEPIRQALLQSGFVLERERSVSRQVCAARTASPAGLWTRLDKALNALDKPGLRAELERYLAQPESGLFHALQDGRADYHIFHLRRTDVPAGRVSQEIAAQLNGRSARLDQLENPVIAAPVESAWFPFTTPDASKGYNVFALPYAGGGASVYRQWQLTSRDAQASWRVCPLQLPGRESRLTEAAISDMDIMVDQITAAIAPYAHLPWALMGCSLGCKIAFEVARRFEHMGKKPALLFLMACPAPSLPLKRRVSRYNDHDFAGEVRHLGGTPAEIMADPEMMRTIIPILRNDSALAEGYTASPDDKINTPIVMVAASDDHLVTVEEARRWGRHTAAGFEWRMVDGGHFFLRKRRLELLGWLADALRASESEISETVLCQ
ncbi:thioesterase domain-containing protein [Undibacterium pigrum]|uniref:Surfactin synthase thioesterase subunit n=1 Tax=Undibacterium pigrum TaxID=401470 RepID=A0A318JHC3_9BURK|nr:thioesterase domain-containing protein [Undibacterium pigrum]PXX46799.1 surfactin synthase thioesterase subunit [Undibacterium pigrum]